MNAKKFSDAMDELNSKYVEEALSYKRKAKKSARMKWGITAACLCLMAGILTIMPPLSNPQEGNIAQESNVKGGESSAVSDVVAEPGFFMLTVYAASPNGDAETELQSHEEVIMREGIEIPVDYHWNPAMSSRPGIPLKLSTPEYPDMTYEISVDGGELLLWESDEIIHLGSSTNAKNNTTVYWTSMTQTEDGDFERYTESEAYIDIVIREEENIVGYAVVKIYAGEVEKDPLQTYYAKLLKSVSFPKVNGEYQEVTAEYVSSEMGQIKNDTQEKQR